MKNVIKKIPSKHNIYLLKSYGDNKEILKLGFSSSIRARLRHYLEYNPLIEIIGTWFIKDGLTWEQSFHKNNKSIIGREWYDISIKEDILKRLKQELETVNEEVILI